MNAASAGGGGGFFFSSCSNSPTAYCFHFINFFRIVICVCAESALYSWCILLKIYNIRNKRETDKNGAAVYRWNIQQQQQHTHKRMRDKRLNNMQSHFESTKIDKSLFGFWICSVFLELVIENWRCACFFFLFFVVDAQANCLICKKKENLLWNTQVHMFAYYYYWNSSYRAFK